MPLRVMVQEWVGPVCRTICCFGPQYFLGNLGWPMRNWILDFHLYGQGHWIYQCIPSLSMHPVYHIYIYPLNPLNIPCIHNISYIPFLSPPGIPCQVVHGPLRRLECQAALRLGQQSPFVTPLPWSASGAACKATVWGAPEGENLQDL